MAGGKLVMKVFTIAIGIPVGIVTKKLANQAFALARAEDAEYHDADETGVPWKDALVWAAISGVSLAVTELVSRKGAEETWRVLVGTEPPEQSLSKSQKRALKQEKKQEKKAGTSAQ